MLPNMEFKIGQVTFLPGDSLLLYTDGVIDARGPAEDRFTEQRLLEAATSPAPSAQARIQNIMDALDEHIAGREQYDDVTLLAVKRKE